MKQSLTLYALNATIKEFDDAIRSEVLEGKLETFDLDSKKSGFEARLYSVPQDTKEPNWAKFLRDGGFHDFKATPTAMNRVALILRLKKKDGGDLFAATFGSGRFLLRPTAYKKGYGLRVALNTIYDGNQEGITERLRQIKATHVAGNTFHTSRQANRNAAFQDFEIDLTTDLLNGVVGAPSNAKRWGSRISGGDSVSIHVVDSFVGGGGTVGLLEACKRLRKASSSTVYKTRFTQLDQIRGAPNAIITSLEDALLTKLSQSPQRFVLAPPRLIDFDEAAQFSFSIDTEELFDDLRIGDFLNVLRTKKKKLSVNTLKKQRVRAFDSAGIQVYDWGLFEVLDGEFEHDDRTFLLVNGQFWEVDNDLVRTLNNFVDSLPPSEVELPPSKRVPFVKDDGTKAIREETEGEYNIRAAREGKHALMDKKTVKISSFTDAIEVCDVFTTKKQFVHVKRKFGSSLLSHLFGQGAVSSELFIRSPEYRQKTREKLDGHFRDLIPAGHPDPGDFEVCYAIIGPWENKPPSKKLPFFSKLNLRRHVVDLRTLGFKVTYKKIDLPKIAPK